MLSDKERIERNEELLLMKKKQDGTFVLDEERNRAL